jgi:hypothetical protein
LGDFSPSAIEEVWREVVVGMVVASAPAALYQHRRLI